MFHLASLFEPSSTAFIRLFPLMTLSIPSRPTASAGGSMAGDNTASTQCVNASIPAPAVKTGGRPTVRSGSQIAALGTK